MIFKSIKMVNFRQFRDEVEIEFSTNKSITLMIAKNGVGKTTLLQAFRYCFYGDSPNYLKLPASNELLNNSLRDEIRETEKAPFSVMVYFSHENIDYYAKREKVYQKRKGKIIEAESESFILNRFHHGEGFKPLKQDESELLMRQIMPPGLAHIYMFDGERMEKRVETSEYKKDLKDAITGILGIKKLETALNLLGTENMKSRVLGMVYDNLKANSLEEVNALNERTKLSSDNEMYSSEILSLGEQRTKIKMEIDSWRDYQKEFDNNKAYIIEIEILESKKEADTDRYKSLAKEGVSNASKILKLNKLAKVYNDYKVFINKYDDTNEFFQSLHIDTLKDIINKKRCICGEEILKDSSKYNKILSLEKHVLPYDNAHYLNKINEEFQQILEVRDLVKKLDANKKDIVAIKENLKNYNIRISSIENKIKDFERQFDGRSPQVEIDRLKDQDGEINNNIRLIEFKIEQNTKRLKEIEGKIKNIIRNEDSNIKIESVIQSLKRVKSRIDTELTNNVNLARLNLEKNLNDTLSTTFEGNFHAILDENFELNIKQRVPDMENTESYHIIDQTRILSTGQSVMVSLSFINALLRTLDDIRSNTLNKHGVIMDAALSNVDEKHIANVCKNILNNFDQLIFLSFKRQLRDEFYKGIGENIGLSYIMEKNESGNVFIKRINSDDLREYIHSIEEVE